MSNKQYTANDIKVLSDIEHVRTRLPVYAGNTTVQQFSIPFFNETNLDIQQVQFVPAVYKCVNEIIDNSLDEFAQIKQTNKTLQISASPERGYYSISDNGRGVPIEKHETGTHAPELVFGSLRSGRNFVDTKSEGVIGANGMGSAIVNFCSTEFDVHITRDNKSYKQTFSNGGKEITKPTVRKGGKNTGTSITFTLDQNLFDDVTLTDTLLQNRAKEIALTNPGINVQYNQQNFKFKKGFEEYLKQLNCNYFKFEHSDDQIFVVFDLYEGIDEQMFTWVNSSFLFDGGICNTQFMNSFYDYVIEQTKREANKQKCEVTKNDIKKNLMVIANLRVSNPEYDSQSKTRLTGPGFKKHFTEMLDNNWSSFHRKHKQWFETVVQRAAERHHQQANKKAVKQHQKQLGKKIPGLIDANSQNRNQCQLIVTEGDSAAGMVANVRDPNTMASLPLRGKINNVHGTTVAQLLKMGKVTDLLASIGLVPGQKAIRGNLRYGRVLIATDADQDGSDIMTLLVNLFFTFWPELFDPNDQPFFYRLIAPNVCAIKGDKRIHFPTREQYENQKNKYRNWKIKYFKGLGSMSNADWRMILSGETDTLIPIQDVDHTMKETLELLFGPDTNGRKEWLQQD